MYHQRQLWESAWSQGRTNLGGDGPGLCLSSAVLYCNSGNEKLEAVGVYIMGSDMQEEQELRFLVSLMSHICGELIRKVAGSVHLLTLFTTHCSYLRSGFPYSPSLSPDPRVISRYDALFDSQSPIGFNHLCSCIPGDRKGHEL